MKEQPKSHILVIGIGNEFRRDDAVGLVVARRLKYHLPTSVTILEESGEGTRLVELWNGAVETSILIDAVHSGSKPGKIHRFDAFNQRLPTRLFPHSTHTFGMAEAIEMARTLNRLPRVTTVYGIEGEKFEPGVGLSSSVETSAHEVTKRIQKALAEAPAYSNTSVHLVHQKLPSGALNLI